MINNSKGNGVDKYKQARIDKLQELQLDCHDFVTCRNGQIYEILFCEVDNIIARLVGTDTPCNINPVHIVEVIKK